MLREGEWDIKTTGMFEIVSDAHTYYYSRTLRNGKSTTNPFAPPVSVRACRVPETYNEFKSQFPTTAFYLAGDAFYFAGDAQYS